MASSKCGMMKIVKNIAFIFLIILVTLQFFRSKNNLAQGNHSADFLSQTNPPLSVKVILQDHCYNCHSNNTTYPWYSELAPVSFWLAQHIKKGKMQLNFSEWNTYSENIKAQNLESISEVVKSNRMLLKNHSAILGVTKLSKEQRSQVIRWAKKTKLLYQLNSHPQ